MSPLRIIVGLLVVSPAVVFVLHAILYRGLSAAGRRPTAHASALLAIVATFLFLTVSVGWLEMSAGASGVDFLCTAAYVSVVYAGLAVLYVDVVNVVETSLHMHLLLELAWTGGLPIAELQQQYSAERMIAARLERLIGIGQLRVVDGRCYLGSRSALGFNACIDVWRTILGMPTDPQSNPPGPRS